MIWSILVGIRAGALLWMAALRFLCVAVDAVYGSACFSQRRVRGHLHRVCADNWWSCGEAARAAPALCCGEYRRRGFPVLFCFCAT